MGYDEVSLNSLSTTDHSKCAEMLNRLNKRLGDTGISISVPVSAPRLLWCGHGRRRGGEKKGGLTFAPEAGSQRMRDIINKNVTEEGPRARHARRVRGRLAPRQAVLRDGSAGETDEVIVAIAQLADHTLEIAREVVPQGAARRYLRLHLGKRCSSPRRIPVPVVKLPQLDDAEARKRRQQLLFHSVKNRAVRIHCHDARHFAR